jgi:hypothetical protein
LDDTKSPAYYGTSIEARSENEKMLEYRATMEEIQEDAMKKHEEIYQKSEEEHQKVEIEKKEAELELIVEKIVIKVLEKINGTREEKTIPEETLVEEEGKRAEKIDYSLFEERISKLK